MPVRANRALDKVTRALGGDVTAEQLSLDAGILGLVSTMDDLTHAHPASASGRLIMSFIPSAGVAKFSAIELCPARGFWVRELFLTGGNNATFIMLTGGVVGAFGVQDAQVNIASCIGQPEGTDFVNALGVITNPNLSQLYGTTPGQMTVFRGANVAGGTQVGQANAQPGGVFLAANGATLKDIWVPPGVVFGVYGVTANAAISLLIQIELTSDHFSLI